LRIKTKVHQILSINLEKYPEFNSKANELFPHENNREKNSMSKKEKGRRKEREKSMRNNN